ncbi:MAG TPA: helix-turn-helix domain-containing protein [Longimicrobiales bacterium]|nr:helix-turn-helix domain-containing protein [Longimicrobiales bacterium]
MTKRSYGQFCGVARALDSVGERWTLLLVREVLSGPRRFKELLDALPGIGPNLLSARLKGMTEEGVLKRVALPGAGGVGYELTEVGRELEPAVLALARWGARRLRAAPEEAAGEVRPDWAILLLRARFQPERAEGVSEVYQVEAGDSAYHLYVREGRLEVAPGKAPVAAVVLATDPGTLAELAAGRRGLEAAASAGALEVRGSPFAAARFARVFGLEGAG